MGRSAGLTGTKTQGEIPVAGSLGATVCVHNVRCNMIETMLRGMDSFEEFVRFAGDAASE